MKSFNLKINEVKNKKYSGLVFRAFSSSFFNYSKGKIEKREGFNLLKKLSFKDKWFTNGGMFECFADTASMSPEAIIYPKDIEQGKLYGLRVINESRDYETGIVDDYDLEFFKLEN